MVHLMRKLAMNVGSPMTALARRSFASSSTDSALASLKNQSFLSTTQLSYVEVLDTHDVKE